MDPQAKRRALIGGVIGAVSGVALSSILFFSTGNWFTLGFIPVAIILGAAQAIFFPRRE